MEVKVEDSERETFLFHRGKQLSVIVLQRKVEGGREKLFLKKLFINLGAKIG